MAQYPHAAQYEYERLFERLNALAQRTSGALQESLTALRRNDPFGAARLIAADEDLDALRYEVEELAIRLIAIWQPMARNLRRLIAVIEIAGELERIGDYAGQIAGQIRRAHTQGYTLPQRELLLELGGHARSILSTAMAAFLAEDAEAARRLAALDNDIDQLNDRIDALIHSDAANGLLSFQEGHAALEIARALERSADRATNIAERTIYLATATHESLNP